MIVLLFTPTSTVDYWVLKKEAVKSIRLTKAGENQINKLNKYGAEKLRNCDKFMPLDRGAVRINLVDFRPLTN